MRDVALRENYLTRISVKKSYLKYVVAIALMLGALWLAFRNVDFAKLMDAMSHANPVPLLGGVAIMLVAHAVRAWRWQIILRPVKPNSSFARSFKAVMVGYATNNLVPRSGEIIRPYLMSKGEGFPLSAGIASIVVERLTDVVALGAIVAMSFVAFRDELSRTFPTMASATLPLLLLMVVVLGGAVWVLASESRTASIARFLGKPFPPPIASRLELAAVNFAKGLQGIGGEARIPLILGTAAIWGLYGVSMWVSLQGFDDMHMHSIGFGGALMLLTLSGLAYTVPTPGGTGTYHFFISQALIAIFLVPNDTAVAYAVLTHILSYTIVTIAGLVIMSIEGVSMGRVNSLAENPEATA